jgi:hypothetical protein
LSDGSNSALLLFFGLFGFEALLDADFSPLLPTALILKIK